MTTNTNSEPSELARVHDPGALLGDIFGANLPPRGVVHVAAVARVEGFLRVLEIGPNAPKSDTDFFVLNAVRAWADVIVTSGQIVRAEPDLDFSVQGPTALAREALEGWRGDRPEVRVLVLSTGRGLGPDQRVWQRGGRFSIVTDRRGAQSVRPWANGVALGVIVQPSPSPRAAVLEARGSTTGARRVSVELGPSTSADLYQPPPLVDTLLLSEFLGEVDGRDDVQFVGQPFLPDYDLNGRFVVAGPPRRFGSWSFSRWDAVIQQDR